MPPSSATNINGAMLLLSSCPSPDPVLSNHLYAPTAAYHTSIMSPVHTSQISDYLSSYGGYNHAHVHAHASQSAHPALDPAFFTTSASYLDSQPYINQSAYYDTTTTTTTHHPRQPPRTSISSNPSTTTETADLGHLDLDLDLDLDMEMEMAMEMEMDLDLDLSRDPKDLSQYGTQTAAGTWRCAYPGCSSTAVFRRGCDLRKHYNRHRKYLFCRYEGCPQAVHGGFSSKKDRDRHEAKHNPEIPCEWEGCNRVFSRVDNMKDHVRRIHRRRE
ncbi:hypothetical protein ARAM_006642 [Aspergillus rambellii]|uniref:C2H2-type domain-containing protein n=1 Tax=Aspergillus rambellii TaxID=308745 RepID=A0A0F8UN10_9EURO|nr:hypothetical protein ARAM_006642 [Aspergillus rambellii]